MPDDPREDLRADLDAAISKVESVQPEPAPEPVAQAEPSMTPAGDEPNPEAAAEPSPSATSPAASPEKPASEQAAAPETAPKKRKGPSAPVDWTPEQKAQFKTLPEWAQENIHKREVAVNQLMQSTVEARRLSEAFVQTLEPYRALMQAEGVQNPLQAVDGLLKTAAQLQLGSPAQKAQRMAQMVKHYGIDIEMLDKALASEVPQDSEETRLQRILDERLRRELAPVHQLMQQAQVAQAQQQQQVAYEGYMSVEEFKQQPGHEHYDAVRTVMADFLDQAAAHGQVLSLEDAYLRACAITPGIGEQVVLQRLNGAQQQVLAQKQNAASSIIGRRGGGGTGNPDLSKLNTVRDVLEALVPGAPSRV